MQGRQQHGELITAQARHQVILAQLRSDPGRDGGQYRVTGGVPKVVIDALETITVQVQDGHLLVELVGITQRTDQPALEKRPVRQPRQTVVAGLVGQGFVLALQMGLPGLKFSEQRIEVIAQIVQLCDVCRWHPTVRTRSQRAA